MSGNARDDVRDLHVSMGISTDGSLQSVFIV
jgi:hypothetical protein